MAQGRSFVQEKVTIASGIGILMIGPAHENLESTYPNLTNFQEVGAIEGDVELVIGREYLRIFDGQPQILLQTECVQESARISCQLRELRLQQVAQILGFSSSKPSFVSGGTLKSGIREYKALFDDSWARLMQRNVTVTQVKSISSTPVYYTKDVDYKVDETEGAIRRIPGGQIADGQVVEVVYDFTTTDSRILKFGGDTQVTPSGLVFIHQRPQDKNRELTIFPKCYPAESMAFAYRQGAVNTRTLVFEAASVNTSNLGERLFWKIHEGETQKTYETNVPV